MLVPPASLEAFIRDKEDEQTGERLRTLAYRLGLEEKDLPAIKAHCTGLTAIIIAAATGTVPDDKKDADKSVKKALQTPQKDGSSLWRVAGSLRTKCLPLVFGHS